MAQKWQRKNICRRILIPSGI